MFDSLFYTISQSRTEIIILIVIISILLVIFLWRIRAKRYKIYYNDTMPHNLWFYSQLLDLEAGIKVANSDNLLDIFVKFLHRKYWIKAEELKSKSLFDLVREREDDVAVLDLYGEIWNSVEELKHAASNEVVSYIKSIKLLFNKGDFDAWIRLQKMNKPCNDC